MIMRERLIQSNWLALILALTSRQTLRPHSADSGVGWDWTR
jgi:hypothetical protein